MKTQSLNKIRSGTSNQCSSLCSSRDRPRSYFLVEVITRAAATRTHCNLSVVYFGTAANDTEDWHRAELLCKRQNLMKQSYLRDVRQQWVLNPRLIMMTTWPKNATSSAKSKAWHIPIISAKFNSCIILYNDVPNNHPERKTQTSSVSKYGTSHIP